MSILIFILKILGILLLVILLLAALFLFHPVFYQIKGEIEEEVSAEGYFWWLFQILRLEFKLEHGSLNFRVRIFGFSKKSGKKEDKNPASASEVEIGQSLEPAKEGLKQSGTAETEAGSAISVKKEKSSDIRHKNLPEPKERPKKKTTFRKEKNSGWKEQLLYWKNEAADKGNRQAIAHLWKEFWYLLAHLKPKYFQAEISFSAGDPAVTGEVTGALSLLPIMYRYDAHMYPDFLSDEFYIRGNLKIKGHMALFHFVRSLIRLFGDKKIKRLYHKFK